MYKKLLLVFFILLLMLIVAYTQINKDSIDNKVEVRGVTLKVSLVTVAYDVYRSNFKNVDEFNEDLYKNCGEYGVNYYKWLKETYSTMDPEMKRRLIRIYDNYGDWKYVSETISLDDNASVKEVVEKINNQSNLELSQMRKEDIDIFYNYFYKEYLKEFIESNNSNLELNRKKVNTYLEKENIDIFKFMEDESGIKFKKDYTALFYYDLRPIGAMGFENGNYKISTIQPYTNKEDLFRAPFHEYSHELFRNFTISKEFIKISNELKKDKALLDSYNSFGKDAYDWVGWCEENLVEGFAKYLEHKYYNHKKTNTTYVYDVKFYNYLIDNKFNPKDTDLKDVSIKFYEDTLSNNSN